MTALSKTVLIAGAGTFSHLHAGDEAILATMANDLRSLAPGADLAVVSANPSGALAPYGIREIHSQDITQIINAAQASGLLILGGGGLFHDYGGVDLSNLLTKSHHGQGFYLGFALLATLLNKPLMMYGVGVGPLQSELGRSTVRLAFEQAHIATVRDQESKELLESLGIAGERIQVTADPAFNFQPAADERVEQLLGSIAKTSFARPLVGVALRPWELGVAPNYWEHEVAAALDRFLEQYGGAIIFVPFHRKDELPDSDRDVSERVRSRMKYQSQTMICADECRPEEKAGLLKQCDLVLGMRLHSLIFAIKFGVPAVALSYDAKVANVMTSVQSSEYTINLDALTAERLTALLGRAYQNRARLRALWQVRMAKLTYLGQENARLAANLLLHKVVSPPPLTAPTIEMIKGLLVKHTKRAYEFQASAEIMQVQLVEQNEGIAWLRSEMAVRNEAAQTLHAQLAEKEATQQALHAQATAQEQTGQTLLAQAADGAELSAPALTMAADNAAPTLTPAPEITAPAVVIETERAAPEPPLEAPAIAPEPEIIAPVITPAPEITAPAIVLEAEQAAPTSTPEPERVAPAETRQHIIISPESHRRVPILAPLFFDFEGNNMFFGGAERYLIELVRLVREMGYEPEVYQCARSAWVRYYGDMRVVGMAAEGDVTRFNERFHALVPEGALTIYLAFFLATPQCHPRSIGISHGVYWDYAVYQATPEAQQQRFNEIYASFTNVTQIVSVDTNTINWVRGIWLDLAHKFTYIPNFVDPEQFRPAPRRAEAAPQRLRILYPRRLSELRGFWLVADLIPEFAAKYLEVDFHFVGKADAREEAAARELTAHYPGRVQWYFLPPERMAEAYQQADITLIPTVSSEGTSLSCLEALASGNAVVATNVGGLPDLIISEHNGLLIEPTAAALRGALTRLVENPALRRRLSRRGRRVARDFSLERWREQWRETLRHYLPTPSAPPLAPVAAPVAFFPTAPGVSWELNQQRPHHLARQLAAHGIETFWSNPTGRQPSPAARLHIIAPHDDLYLKAPLLFINYPYHFERIAEFEQPFVIYDVPHDLSIQDQADAITPAPTGESARDYHCRLLKRADLVTTSSRTLRDQLRAQRPDVLLVPNGVDLEHFAKEEIVPAEELAEFAQPVIGYHGALAEWFDAELLSAVARLRPQYQFVLIGVAAPLEPLDELLSQPNVHYLGSVPYEQMPRYVAGFDVGIVPFHLNQLTAGMRPLKALEYLALGKPVVATPLPELSDWPGVLRARTAAEFAARLDMAVEQCSVIQDDPHISDFVAEAAWPVTVRPLLRAIAEQNR